MTAFSTGAGGGDAMAFFTLYRNDDHDQIAVLLSEMAGEPTRWIGMLYTLAAWNNVSVEFLSDMWGLPADHVIQQLALRLEHP